MTLAADSPDRDRPIVDPAAALELAPNTWFFTSINPDGSTTIWSAGNNQGHHGCNCPTCAPHEQLHPMDGRRDG